MRLKSFPSLVLRLAACALFFLTSPSFADRIQSMDDPRVNVEKFRFEDYDDEGLKAFAAKHFPVGTKKEFIDTVLIESGGAKQTGVLKDKPAVGLSLVIYKYEYGGPYACNSAFAIPFDEAGIVAGKTGLYGGCI